MEQGRKGFCRCYRGGLHWAQELVDQTTHCTQCI